MHVIVHGMRVVKTEKMLFWKQIWISVLLDNVTKKPLKHKQNTPLFTAKQTYSVQGSSNLDVPCKEFLLTSLSRLIQISMQSFITMLLLWSFKFQLWQVFNRELVSTVLVVCFRVLAFSIFTTFSQKFFVVLIFQKKSFEWP